MGAKINLRKSNLLMMFITPSWFGDVFAFVFGSLLTLWLFFLLRGMGNMSARHKYDFSWGEGSPVGGGD